jgi:predicted exporter
MDRIFVSVHQYFRKRKLLFFSGTALLFMALVWGAFTIEFDEDISKLIPTSAQNTALQRVMESAAFSDRIIVHLQRDFEGTTDDLTEYASAFLDSLRTGSAQYIEKIQGEVAEDNILETLDFVYENIPVFLDSTNYEQLSTKLSPDSINRIVESNFKTLVSPSGILAKKTIVRDPLGISLLGLEKLKKLGASDAFQIRDGFLVSRDGQHLLLFVSPKYRSGETAKNEPLVNNLYRIRDQLDLEYNNKVSVQYFGGVIIGVENARQIKQDTRFTVGIALTLLLLLFIFFYRKIMLPVILFTPTVFGGLMALVCLSMLRTEISAISLGIGSVLIGVTLDYSLHILTHIRNGETKTRVLTQVSRPILMSSLTTALAFLCLLFIDSRALQDLGIFAAVSVLAASVFSLIFIPLTYTVRTKEVMNRTILDRFAAFDFHKRRLLIGVLLAVGILSVFTYSSVGFSKDVSRLNYTSEEIKQAENGLDDLLNTQSKSVYVTAYGADLQQALEANDTVFTLLQNLEKQQKILSYNSVGALLASEKKQFEKISDWKQFWTPEKTTQTQDRLIQSGELHGFKPTTHSEFYSLLKKDFKPIAFTDYSELNLMDVNDFVNVESDIATVTSLIKVSEENLNAVKANFANTNGVVLIDRVEINETLLGSLQTDFNRLLLYCSIIIAILLFLYYRNWKLWLVTLLPIGFTWLITVGLMGLFQIDFNVFNVIICSFIFGLGVDYSIFITNGLILEHTTKLSALATHKTSILLSVITTLLGVGVLIFAKHPALYSVSVVTVIGITSALLIALTLQPVLYNLLIFNSEKKTPL